MKFNLFVSLICVAVAPAVVNAATNITIYSENQFGIVKVESATNDTLIAVPWLKLGVGDSDIAISNLVKTAPLTVGDRLFVLTDDGDTYDQTRTGGPSYDSYLLKLNSGTGIKYWASDRTATVDEDGNTKISTSGDSSSVTVKRGSAVWLVRTEKTNPIYLYGQVKAGTSADASASAGWNLISCPKVDGAFDLNSVTWTGVDADDVIVDVSYGTPINYTYAGGAWGYLKASTTSVAGHTVTTYSRVTTGCTVKSALGFWYYRKDGASTLTMPW